MFEPKTTHTQVAWNTIKTYIKTGDVSELEKKSPPEELSEQLACFVTLHKTDGSLRGCIGTVEPIKPNLYQEIINNAVSAITRDTRFPPVTGDELEDIDVSVDVLSKPEKVDTIENLDPSVYGVIVSDGKFKKGLLLPGIEGINSVEKQLNITKRKAGLEGMDNAALDIYYFTTTRYH